MKALILIILIYLGYRLFKTWLIPGKSTTKMPDQGGLTPVDDVMVQDPFCETYFPRQQGISHKVKGETVYF